MPTATYIALANYTVPSNAASVTFSSIPATYRDLVLIMSYKAADGVNAGKAFVNGDTTAGNYTSVRMKNLGGSPSSNANGGSIRWETQSTSEATTILNFMDYSATDKHKTVLVRAGAADTQVEASATRWANTNAITSIAINFLGTDLVSGSTLALYGIAS
jgi:hypothetical protein